jgi:hypothetical protein
VPACKIIIGKMLGQDTVWENENLPLSGSTTNGRIDGMSLDDEDFLSDKLKNNAFSLHFDMSTTFTKKLF